MDASHQMFVVTTDEFAYPARGVAALLSVVAALAEGPSDGVDRYEVEKIDCWDGVTVPTADDWGRIGEGAGCRLCCAARMDGSDADGRPAFLREGPSCKGCAA